MIGSLMSMRLEQAGKSGVISGWAFDASWPGGSKNTAWWKNVTGVLTEVASVRVATPVDVPASELRGGGKGLVSYGTQVNFPNPWRGGAWRLRDVMDYERIASDALLEYCATHREDVLSNMLAQGARRRSPRRPPGEAYRIPMAPARPGHGPRARRAPRRARRRGEGGLGGRRLGPARAAVRPLRPGDARAAALSRGEARPGEGHRRPVRRHRLEPAALDGRDGGEGDPPGGPPALGSRRRPCPRRPPARRRSPSVPRARSAGRSSPRRGRGAAVSILPKADGALPAGTVVLDAGRGEGGGSRRRRSRPRPRPARGARRRARRSSAPRASASTSRGSPRWTKGGPAFSSSATASRR